MSQVSQSTDYDSKTQGCRGLGAGVAGVAVRRSVSDYDSKTQGYRGLGVGVAGVAEYQTTTVKHRVVGVWGQAS